MKKFVLIDASAIIHRAFHALPPLSTRSGQLVNAVYGFCLTLLKVLNEIKPDYIAVAFDSKKPTFRHKEFPAYKAKRIKKGEELYSQFPLVREVLEAFGIPIYEMEGYEADDIIATLVAKGKREKEKEKIESIIVTGDLDALVLVDRNTKVYGMRKGLTDIVVYDEDKVLQRYGFSPSQLADFKGLAGDSSDNIPGVKGIGEKMAADLIKKYHDLNTIYQNIDEQPEKVKRLLANNKANAFLSKKLASLVTDLPIEPNLAECRYKGYDTQKVANLFYRLDFKSLIPRLNGASVPMRLFPEKAETEAEKIDQALEPILREMEQVGVMIDVAYLNKLAQEVGSSILNLKTQIYQSAGGEFNLDSPRQLSQILFTRLNLAIKGIKKTKTGISTAASELLKLRATHPIIDLILKYRELSKLKSTYLDTLPKMVDKNDRLHTTYAQDTQTGRISSKNPNLQNIPIKTELGRMIRRGFVAPAGFVLLSADYSQIELRILAHLSKDPKLVSAFLKGIDIHEAVAKSLNVSRRVAKTINYGIIYGMSSHGLAETLGVSHPIAEEYINRFFDSYPKLRLFIQDCIGKAKEKGYIETIFGRRRYLPEINSPIPATRAAAERMAINMPCQGSGADILKLAMIKLNSKLKVQNSKLILTVHDELVFEVPKKEIKKVAKMVKEIMENVVKLDVPIVVEMSQGKNWGEMEELE
jgi:5'-3' exonuclease